MLVVGLVNKTIYELYNYLWTVPFLFDGLSKKQMCLCKQNFFKNKPLLTQWIVFFKPVQFRSTFLPIPKHYSMQHNEF